MNLNISIYTPSIPNSNSIESHNPQRIKTGTGIPPAEYNSHDAAIIHLSPEAINKNQNSENSTQTKTRLSKTHESQDNENISPEEKQITQKLQQIDLHIKIHEQQHLAAAGPYAKGGASFHYMRGPDGKLYAVGGEVALDTSPVPNNPQATITKAQVIRQAALAPSDPSGADRAIAAAATQMEAQARSELATQKNKESSSQPKSNTINTGINIHYFIKAYQHQLQFHSAGNYFNIIA